MRRPVRGVDCREPLGGLNSPAIMLDFAIVPAGEVNRPKSEINLQQREIKRTGVAAKPEKPPERACCTTGARGAGKIESAGEAPPTRRTGTGQSCKTCSAGAARLTTGARGTDKIESAGEAPPTRRTGTGESCKTCSAGAARSATRARGAGHTESAGETSSTCRTGTGESPQNLVSRCSPPHDRSAWRRQNRVSRRNLAKPQNRNG